MIKARDFSVLIGMDGFSDTLLNNHFKLYQGYVKNTNIIFEKLDALLTDNKDRTVEYAELERRLSWELDGALLHEYYFENLGGKEPFDVKSPLYKKITEEFGSFDRWKQDFVSVGLMRGIGWVVLYWEPTRGRLLNIWVNEHNIGHIVAAKPLLVMDVFEHAYMTDYQLDRAKYIDAFFKNINWDVVTKRFNECFM
ncbi:MAG: superoxide dismutase [Candidatus Omnitrophica bacterium]|nr:superoxide dismutase [Candidatus Omnitrophota bacterium]